MIAVSFFLCRRVWYTEENVLVNFSLSVGFACGRDGSLDERMFRPRARYFCRDTKVPKKSPGRPRTISLRYPRRPGPPLRKSRRPCADLSLQSMRALTPPFASQNGEDFTGDKQCSPPRWRQRLTAVASYPPGLPGRPMVLHS